MNSDTAHIKILYIIPSLMRGGAETSLLFIVRELIKKKLPVEFRILTMIERGSLADEIETEGVVVDCINAPAGDFLANFRGVLKYIRTYRPAIVHSHLWHSDKFALLASVVAGVRYRLSTLHSFELSIKKKEFLWKIFLSRLSTGIIAVSNSVKDLWVGKRCFPEKKITVIYNAPGFKTPSNIKARSKCSRRIRILNLGRISEEKGNHYSLMAMAELLKEYPDATLDIYGPCYNDEYMLRLTDYIDKNSIGGSVFFKGPSSNPMEIFPHYDIVLLLSVFEGFPLICVEAMSCGIPIVASAIPPHREIFEDGKYALLVRADNSGEVCSAIKKLFKNDDLYRMLSTRGIERSKFYSREKMVDRYYAYYDAILKEIQSRWRN
ncbi:MAG: glycosyltransferase [Spirochaetes bacterium]|nr:glycosyltransferase [Spirochaetota bacterium]